MNQDDIQNAGSPEMLSLMGYSLAREAGQFRKGIELCLKAIALNPHNSDHYLHLGRIYLLAKKKDCRRLADQRDQQQQQCEAAEQRPRPERQVPTLSPADAVSAASSGTNT